MTHAQRRDGPGALHHVMNRGIARRTMFETLEDIRKFLSLTVREVWAGQIKVRAYVFMTTHFHIYLESVTGDLSAAMRRIESMYVRYFNDGRERDGPLVRGRFRSKRIRSTAYQNALVAYIDRNATEAGLARHGAFYAHGSASHYMKPSGPIWLDRQPIERVVTQRHKLSAYDPAKYAQTFSRGVSSAQMRWVEARIASGNTGPDPIDDLLVAAPDRVLDWMRRTAELADGTDVGCPLADADSVVAAVARAEAEAGPWRVRASLKFADGWGVLRRALLLQVAGETMSSAAGRDGAQVAQIRRARAAHADLILRDTVYAERAATLAHAALHRCHDAPPGPILTPRPAAGA